MQTISWKPENGDGLEHLVRDAGPDTISARSVVIGDDEGNKFGLSYRINCTPDWSVREFQIVVAGGASLRLSALGQAGLWEKGGLFVPELTGCIDIDIEATPFTNTLPIRRLMLAPGERRIIRVVYISVPSLRVHAAEQAYTRLAAPGRYLYESPASGFRAELETDPDGLVIDYPGFFHRTG
ncbi:MAG TPA: putative glycolipid-binding domain-containing protein [Rhizomicrobium sp.]|jgi:hypothetical protein|nr:putative glycolipid-binding domain-containing protein [Rhizomicrobium sp.]